MADTSIKISLELADRAAQKALGDFISKSGSADKALNKLKNSGSGTFNEITLGIGKSIGAYEVFAGNLAANVAVKSFEVVAEAAHKLFDTFIVDGVKSAIQTQDALNSLNVALAQNGQYSKATAKEFAEYADQIQKTTAYSDDQALSTAALVESLGSLDKEGLKKATSATLDLASALKIDLNAAAVLVGKAAQGEISSFTRYGLVIQKGSTAAETFANVLKTINDRFGGTAASKLNTYSGAVTYAQNAFDDFTKSIGKFIIENPVVIDVLKTAGQLFLNWSSATDSQNQAFKVLVGEGLLGFLTASKFLVEEVDLIVRLFQTMYGVIQAVTVPILPLTIAVRSLSVGFTQAYKEAAQFSNNAVKNLTALGKNGRGALYEISTGIGQLQDSAKGGFKSLAEGADGTVEPLNSARQKTLQLSDSVKAAQARLKSFAEDLLKTGESAKNAADQQIQLAQSKADAELAAQQTLLQKKLINESQFQEAKTKIDAEVEAAKQQALDAQFIADQNRLQQAVDQNLLVDGDYLKAKDILFKNHAAAQAKLDAEQKKVQEKDRQAQLQADQKLAQDRIATLGNLAVLMNSKNREMFEIGKAASMAQAGIATYEGAIKAYNSLAGIPIIGPALGAAAAAALTAYGVERQAQIANTKYANGGIVPGTSFSGDRLTANVNSGEMILNRGQQATLFKMANGDGVTSRIDYDAIGVAVARAFIAYSDSQPIVVNVGGNTIVDTLRSELRAGRTLA